MSAFLTPRDYALRLTLSLVLATQAALFALLILLSDNFAAHISIATIIAAVSLLAAARSQPSTLTLVFGATALVAELASMPSHGKAITLVAGLHAAQVLAGGLLVVWTLAQTRWRRAIFAQLTSRYWYFVAIAWVVVGPLVGNAHRP